MNKLYRSLVARVMALGAVIMASLLGIIFCLANEGIWYEIGCAVCIIAFMVAMHNANRICDIIEHREKQRKEGCPCQR